MIGADVRGAVPRRAHAALRRPGLRGEHAGDGRRMGGRRGVHAVVQQRAPRQRLQVAPGDRGVRGRARGGRRVRRRRDGTVVLVRNTTEAINVLAAALPAGSRVLSTAVEHHANMLPWRRHDSDRAADPGQRMRSSSSAASTRCGPRGRGSTSCRHRRLERHRRGVAAGRARRGRAPLRSASSSSTPPSSRRIAPSTWRVRASTTSRCRATSSTRRSGPAHWSRAAAPSSAASRCCAAAGRSSSSRSTTSSGPTRPSATRRARPTWWVRSPWARRAGSSASSAWPASRRTSAACPRGWRRAWPACRACGRWRSGATRRSTASAWRPSSSTATAIRCWPRS